MGNRILWDSMYDKSGRPASLAWASAESGSCKTKTVTQTETKQNGVEAKVAESGCCKTTQITDSDIGTRRSEGGRDALPA